MSEPTPSETRAALLEPTWREEALGRLIRLASAAAPFLVLALSVLRPPPRVSALVVSVWLGASVLISLRFLPQIRYRLRAGLFILSIYVPGLVAVCELGLNPGAAAVVLCGVLLATIYFGRGAAFSLIGLVLGVYLWLGWQVTHGAFALPRAVDDDPALFRNWLRISTAFATMSGFLALSIRYLVGQLERHYEAQALAVSELRARDARWQRCASELSALARSQTLESGDLHGAFGEICEAGARGLGVERCSVWLLDASGESLRCAHLFELPSHTHAEGPTLTAAEYPRYFAALREQRTVAAEDARCDPRTAEFFEGYLKPLGIGSMLDAPIRHGDRLAGVVCHERLGGPRPWPADAQSFAGSMADFAARALGAAERAAKDQALRTAYAELVQFNRRLEAAKEEERRFIAHELHDELIQTLTALKLRFQLLARGALANEARGQVDEAVTLVDDLIARVRKLTLDLRPPLLDESGLAPALRAYFETQAAGSSVELKLSLSGLDERLNPELETACFRVVQEAVTNVLRHSGARRATAEVRRRAHALEIAVSDDGRGFSPESTLVQVARAGRLGLIGMRERARALGGSFELSSKPGAGASLRVVLPLDATPEVPAASA